MTFRSVKSPCSSRLISACSFFVDFASAKFVDKIGYRPCILVAHIFSFIGLILLAFLPEIFGFGGMLASVCVYAVGGGLIEVLISPIMESCPTPNKEKAMSLLHSFYCWGHVAVVLLSTLFFVTVGIEHWKILCFLWAIVPLFNTFLFASSPIAPLLSEGETGMSMKELFSNKTFWLLFVMMLCAGASELTVSQWSAMFALLALAGDVGGVVGPTVAGFVSSITGDNLRLGILISVVFPIVFMICIFGNMIRKEKKNDRSSHG